MITFSVTIMTPEQKLIIRAFPSAFLHLSRISGLSCTKHYGKPKAISRKITKVK
ncbi:hypothetical protein [Geminocystis sp.]|uniref:hypothetical protein n=1 Tax=Geminocystis sp. TaxID=2664100 RepID=UPI00359402A0